MLEGLAGKYKISRTLVFSIFFHVSLFSLSLIIAYNSFKEYSRWLPDTVKHSIKETFPWAILVFTVFYALQTSRREKQDFLPPFLDYLRIIFFAACTLNPIFLFLYSKEALVVLNLSLLISVFLPRCITLLGKVVIWPATNVTGRVTWQAAHVIQTKFDEYVDWKRLQLRGSRKLFVASSLLLILLCSYGLPLFGGFTWSTSSCSPAGRLEYHSRHPGMASSLAFDVVTTSRFTEPRNYLLSKYLKEGTLPLWNPYETTGLPFAADFESKAFFPLNILQAVSPYRIWDAFYLLRIWLAGLFVYLLLRRYSLAVPVSLFGAAAYMLSGPIALNVTMEEMTNGAFILPWLVYAADKLVTGRTLRHVFGLSIPVALIIYAGQPKLALLAMSCSFAYLLARSIHLNGTSYKKTIAIGVKAALALFAGLLLAAPQLLLSIEYTDRACALPTLFLLSDSVKSDSGAFLLMLKHAYSALSLHSNGDDTGGLILTLLPNSLGFVWRPWVTLYQERGWWAHPAYIGITVGFFAFFAISCYRRYGSQHRFLVIFWSIVCFVLVSGNYGFKMTSWIQAFAYGGYLRYYAPVFVLSSVIVASLGVELLCNIERESVRKRLLIAFAILLGFVAFALMLPAFSHGMEIYKYADFTLASYCITKSIFIFTSVALAIMLLSTRCSGQSLAWCMVLLVFSELALYVPYGFNLEWDAYRLIPLAIVFIAIFSIAYNNTRLLVTSILLYIVVMTSLIVMSPRGLPVWYNPFKQADYISFLKGQEGEFRTYGIESPFTPDYTSAFQIKDIRSFAPFVPLEFAHYMKRLLCPSQRPTMFEGTAWGPYPHFLTSLSEYYQYKRFYDFLGIRYLTTNNMYRLDIEPFPLLGNKRGLGHRELHLKKGDLLSISFVSAPSEICGVMILATSSTGKDVDVPFKLKGKNGEKLERGVIMLESGVPSIAYFTNILSPQEVELTLKLPEACKIRRYAGSPTHTARARVNGDTVQGFLAVHLLKPRHDMPLVYDKEIRIYENKNVFPRTYMVYNSKPFSTLQGLWDTDMRTTALVNGFEGKTLTQDSASPKDGHAKILTYTPHRIVVDVETSSNGLLVLTDTYYPGWKAYVDGERREIHKVNGLVRGVLVEGRGQHTVEFVYRPFGLYLGGILSLSTLAVMLTITRRRKGSVSKRPSP